MEGLICAITAASDTSDLGIFEDAFNWILYNIIYSIFYYLEIALCMVLGWLEELFKVFTGQEMVKFGNGENYLINIFFQNDSIRGVYIGMAAIGLIFAFVSAIISVTRKAFDMYGKVKMSMGQILTNLFKSMMIILSLNVAILIVVTGTNQLMDSLDEIFDNSENIAKGSPNIEFTNEQFAAMARIYNTIGNYSMNPSSKSRYNLNCCYNEIRGDIKYLADTKMFKFDYKNGKKTTEEAVIYDTTDKNGNMINTWQSIIQNIANAADYNSEQPVDVYNEGIANALSDAMEVLKTDSSFEPLERYSREYDYSDNEVDFDNVVFVMGTMGLANTAAAKNDQYNKNPEMTDVVRGPYYRGVKDIYSLDQVNQDFDISIFKTNYIVAYFAALVLGYNMLLILLSAVARIYNMLFLYIIAPPIIGVMPLDDGGKFRQWMTAFIVQTFSIFATIISMRLFLIFVPVVLSPSLVLSDSVVIDMIGKFIMLYAGFEVIGKANGILTGILADQAGMQSIQAADMGGSLKQLGKGALAVGSMGLGAAKLAGKAGLGIAQGTAGAAIGAGKMTASGIKRGMIAHAQSQNALNESKRNAAMAAAAGANKLGQSGGSDGSSPPDGNKENALPGKVGESEGMAAPAANGKSAEGGMDGSSETRVPPPMRDAGAAPEAGSSSGGASDQQFKNLFGIDRADYEAGKSGDSGSTGDSGASSASVPENQRDTGAPASASTGSTGNANAPVSGSTGDSGASSAPDPESQRDAGAPESGSTGSTGSSSAPESGSTGDSGASSAPTPENQREAGAQVNGSGMDNYGFDNDENSIN